MNTIQENSQQELRELEQKRNTLGKSYACAQGAFSAGVLCILAFFMLFKTDDENSIAYSFIGGAFVLLFIAFAVSLFKYRMSHDAVVRKKKELGIPVKEDSSKRFFSTANPTWEEKSGKLLGVVITVLGLLVFIPGWINKYSSLSIDLPAMFKENYLLILPGDLS